MAAEVVGESSEGDEALAYVGRLQPAVVVTDRNMKKMDGITAPVIQNTIS
jgi:DNA-binding NarL/FixJ family response regulator